MKNNQFKSLPAGSQACVCVCVYANNYVFVSEFVCVFVCKWMSVCVYVCLSESVSVLSKIIHFIDLASLLVFAIV